MPEKPQDDGRCFACGPENEDGLKLSFTVTDGVNGAVESTVVLGNRYQGWVGFAHGGLICTLLDEAMAHAGASIGRSCVTAGIQVRYRKPTPLDVPLTLCGKIVSRRSRVMRAEAELRDPAGIVLATSEGDFIDMGPLDQETMLARKYLLTHACEGEEA